MRILYDLSHLGVASQWQRGPSGMFRAIERTALALARREDIELDLGAFESHVVAALTLRYLKKSGSLGTERFIHSPVLTGIGEALQRLRERPREPGWTGRVRRSARVRSSYAAQRALDLAFPRPTRAYAQRIDVFHAPANTVPPLVFGACPATFVTAWDLTPLLTPQYHPRGSDVFVTDMVSAVERGAWCTCISESTRADLLSYSPKIDPSRVSVASLAADETFIPCNDVARLDAIRTKYGIGPAPFFLCLNTLEPRKNVEAAVRCFAKLVLQERLRDARLVLSGARGWMNEKLDELLTAYGGIRDRIVLTGYVNEADLAPLYSAARAFMYLSFYEGFGLPPLEAMSCGVPVICSNTSSLPEVVGDAALLVPPDDDDAICAAMLRAWSDNALCATLRGLGMARAATFTWARTADETVAAYRRATA